MKLITGAEMAERLAAYGRLGIAMNELELLLNPREATISQGGTMSNHRREVFERFLRALGEVKQLPMSSGDRYTCFGCCKPVCKVFWDVDEVCRFCFTMTHQSGDWTDDAIENLKKRG